jgi:RNA polymerase sigma factor (sigma-70 family)
MSAWLQLDDGQLALLLRDHDPRAIEAIYEIHRDLIYKYVARSPIPTDLVEDICTDVLLRVIRDIWSFDPSRSSLRSWLLAIARRTVTFSVRRQVFSTEGAIALGAKFARHFARSVIQWLESRLTARISKFLSPNSTPAIKDFLMQVEAWFQINCDHSPRMVLVSTSWFELREIVLNA